MKRILKKILIVLLIFLLLNNFMMNSAHAGFLEALGKGVSEVLDVGVIGILTNIYKYPILFIGGILNSITRVIAWSEGATDASYEMGSVTVYTVLFNKIKLIDINFFDITDEDNLVNQFRTNVAGWFYILRMISASILLIVLGYIGIRMAISTIASDRAMYKRMLVDWAASLALVFILQYIIMFVLEINNAIVKAVDVSSGNEKLLSAAITTLRSTGYQFFGGTISFVSAIVYIMISWQTIALLFSYFNRMIKIAFLIIISPLITLTYSIDKIGDGKAQALNAWLKEFVFTILIQPFHCIIYMSLISASVDILVKKTKTIDNLTETLGAAILACVCITFTKEAEKIVRKIFAFKDDNKKTSLAAGVATASLVLNKAQSFGKGSIKFANNTKNFIKNASGALSLTNIRAEARAFGKFMRKDNDKSYATLKSEAKADIYEKKAEKISGGEGALEAYYNETQKQKEGSQELAEGAQTYEKALEQEEARIKQEADIKGEHPSKEEIKNLARLNLAKRARTQKVAWRRNISKATGQVSTLKGKITRDISRGAQRINNMIPFKETRALLRKTIVPNSMAIFVGAGSYGLNGNAVNAILAGSSARKFTKEFSSGTAHSVKAKNNELLDKYQFENASEKTSNELEAERNELLGMIAQNPTDYKDSGITDRLNQIVKEITDLIGEPEGQKLVNSISSTIQGTDFEIEDVRENISNTLNSFLKGKNVPSEVTNRVTRNLQNYGIEYGISQNITNAEQSGVKVDNVVGTPSQQVGVEILKQEKENDKIFETVMDTEIIPNNIKKEVREMSPAQLVALNRKFERQIETIRNIPNEADNEELRILLEKRVAEIEAKRDELIVDAITSVEGELSALQKELAITLYQEKEAELKSISGESEKEAIENILEQLRTALNDKT